MTSQEIEQKIIEAETVLIEATANLEDLKKQLVEAFEREAKEKAEQENQENYNQDHIELT